MISYMATAAEYLRLTHLPREGIAKIESLIVVVLDRSAIDLLQKSFGSGSGALFDESGIAQAGTGMITDQPESLKTLLSSLAGLKTGLKVVLLRMVGEDLSETGDDHSREGEDGTSSLELHSGGGCVCSQLSWCIVVSTVWKRSSAEVLYWSKKGGDVLPLQKEGRFIVVL